MVYIGIDPGMKGALAVIYPDGVRAWPYQKTTYLDVIYSLLARDDDLQCCMESVASMPGQGVKSMFSFGMNYGWLQGVLDTCKIPYQLVSPRKWKSEFGATSDKQTSIEICQRLFPNAFLKTRETSRVYHDGMAEALLIAEYARRHMGGEAKK